MTWTNTLLKLKRMPPGEIGGRIKQRVHVGRERRAYLEGRRMGPAATTSDHVATVLGRRAREIVPGAHPDELALLGARHPERLASIRRRCEVRTRRILQGRHELLGCTAPLGNRIDWHRAPGASCGWQRTFYADLSLYELREQGDVKHVWELNRHQFFADLARCWLLERDERAAQRVQGWLLDWIEQNRQFEGVNWTSGLEVAMRSISWIWTLAAMADWPGWTDEDWTRIARSVVEHADYLENHLSYYSSPYNHLVGEATALFLIGTWLGEFPSADRWRRRGEKILCEHGPKQFYEDGFCLEQATGYHFYTLGFLAMAIAVARSRQRPLLELEPHVAKAFRAGAVFKQPGGQWPALGDVDSARSLPVGTEDFWDFRSLCSLGAVLYDDGALKSVGEYAGDELYWLLGSRGPAAWDALQGDESTRQAVLHDSGYAVAQRNEGGSGEWFLLDGGPIAGGLHTDATPSVAHGHADTLQVLYSKGTNAWLADSAIPYYYGPADWIDHFRSPAAHNTLQLDDVWQVRTAGRLGWSHAAPRPRLDAHLSHDLWTARARAEWQAGVTVERHVLVLPNQGMRIADWIETDRARRVRWYWQLPAGTIEPGEQTRDGGLVVQGKELVVAMWSDAGPLSVRVASAETDSPVAWQAPGYGELRRGQRVCFETTVDGRLLVSTYVGSTPAPYDVLIHGQQLACDLQGSLDWETSPCESAQVHADVRWRVPVDERLICVIAGGAAYAADASWTRPDGQGQWPVAWHSCPRCRPADGFQGDLPAVNRAEKTGCADDAFVA